MPPWLPTATVALAFSRINASRGPSYSSRWALPHGFSSTQLIQMAALVQCKAVIRLQHNYTVNCSKVDQGLLNSAKREGDSAVGPFCQKKKEHSWWSLSWRVSLCHFNGFPIIVNESPNDLIFILNEVRLFFSCDSLLVTCDIKIARSCMEWSVILFSSGCTVLHIFFRNSLLLFCPPVKKCLGCVCVFWWCCFCEWMDEFVVVF